MGIHPAALHGQHNAERFTPPTMLDMPYARLADRRAAQEEAYIAWCDERDAHEAQTARRIAQNEEAIRLTALDSAIAKQPGAFGQRAA